MKMLYILNLADKINSFCLSSIYVAKEMDIEYHIAGNWSYKSDEERIADEKKYGIHIHQVDFYRFPLDKRNKVAYKQLRTIAEKEKFDLIHCNTPVGGVLGRIIALQFKVEKVIYQAHGFHFYKGAPLFNWLTYYPIERFLAHFTDGLITINKEDYELSKKFKLRKKGKSSYVPGVGVDIEKFAENAFDRNDVRKTIGLKEDDIVLLSAGRLDINKNNEIVVRALPKLPGVKFVLCGDGSQRIPLEELSKELNVADRVLFLGERSDMDAMYKAADIFALTSFREGLSRSIMEAMATGIPCIVSNIRGNIELIEDNVNGFYALQMMPRNSPKRQEQLLRISPLPKGL